MSHELLDVVELATGLFEPMGESGTQGVGGGAFGDASGMDGCGNGLLNAAGVQVMSLDRESTGVYGEVASREQVLPLPGSGCRGVFTGQGRGHGDRDIGVSLVETAYLCDVSMEALEKLPVLGQEGHPVAVGLGIADDDERVLEVEVLDAQAQSLQEPQAAAIEEAGDEIGCTFQVGEDAEAFVVAEVGLNIGAFLGAEGVQIAKGDAENFLVEEQKGGKGLVLGGGRDLLLGGEVGEESLNLWCAHGGGVAQFVEANKAFVPMEIGFLGADGVSAPADGLAEAVGEFLLWHCCSPLDRSFPPGIIEL